MGSKKHETKKIRNEKDIFMGHRAAFSRPNQL